MDATVHEADSRAGSDFYARLPVFDHFSQLTDPALYMPVPDDWVLGLSDIVRSTSAVEAGRYKEVNTAAAAVIAAVSNELGTNAFPFVFGGDGASFALPAKQSDLAREVLASVAAWVRDSFSFELRIALVPVSEIRADGHDVRIARFAASPDVSYAMFSGGGLAYAERRMKEGAFAVPPAPPGTLPDLTGLTCRFDEIRPQRGIILSLILLPAPEAGPDAFNALVGQVLSLAEGQEAGRPVPDEGPTLSTPFKGFDIEAKTVRKGAAGLVTLAKLAGRRLIAFLILRSRLTIGGFDPTRYRHQFVENTDFRKFDDGLRMTLDCTPALADRLETLLAEAWLAGIARYGLHRQDAALMTCFVPSATRSDHIHFVDGAMGGYAMAARALKPAT
ncbi:DUF3095 domain-containing protein [Microvirga lotononidis]|uniref:Adenylate cyclase n=1 Tax=Microvirga lotononidis TaxID=864069 RepID=I4YPJ0_9HYPH|nr:DUF3095 domain-containing protein [Microvirga lotononidis]EIM25882.1 Protein of unknown function (DUF3095) [Microvirga lotononidis]WQO25801.1 DUF3095 domain-containing protein [Microvirga lotononidis]